MTRHLTPTLVMLTGEMVNGERRTADLIVTDDGRECAVLRHYTPGRSASWHIQPDRVDPEGDYMVSLFPDLDSDDDEVIDWYMPREACEHFVLTFIEAI